MYRSFISLKSLSANAERLFLLMALKAGRVWKVKPS
jgi:uncharacterized membrane protein